MWENDWEMSADKWEAEATRVGARGDEGARHAANVRSFRCELRARGLSAQRVDEITGGLSDIELRVVGSLGRDAVGIL
jgi:hypothetical protein